VPDGTELLAKLGQGRRRMGRLVAERLVRSAAILESLKRGALRRGGERLLREPSMRIDALRSAMTAAARRGLETASQRLGEAKAGHRSIHPLRVLERRGEQLAALRGRFERLGNDAVDRQSERLAALKALLRTLGPESAFQRGFSITLGEDGEIVRSVSDVKPGQRLRTKLADGEVRSLTEDS
jgi:exodeoxyribonuclease VII large subunit